MKQPLFRNLQNQLFFLLVLSTIIPVSTVGLYGIATSKKALSDLSLNQINYKVTEKVQDIKSFLLNINGDVLLLSRVPPIQGIIRARLGNGIDRETNFATSTLYRDWVKRGNQIFSAMAATRSYYRHLRYLDENGNEQIRVDFRDDLVEIASQENLHSEANSVYFQAAMQQKAGDVYVSPIVFEHPTGGVNELPVAVIHYTTLINDQAGHKRGLVVATVMVDAFTKPLKLVNSLGYERVLLVTKEGYYLVHPNLTKVWKSDLNHSDQFLHDYPANIINQILSSEKGTITKNVDKIICYQTLNRGKNNSLVMIYEVPKTTVFALVQSFEAIAASVIVVSLGVVLTIGISVVRQITISQTRLYQQAETAAATAELKAQELEQTLSELYDTQAQLVQTEKLSSLGQLIAGVAHEINNPVSFIYGNLKYVNQYIEEILNIMLLYQQHYPNPHDEIQAKANAVDINFLLEDLPKILRSMRVGAERIRQIVLSLRNFSRLDESDMKAVDIHEGIDSTLMILTNRLKDQPNCPEIELIKDYGDLPLVECYPGQLNQVFMNIIANAIDAIEESFVKDKKLWRNPQIHIHTALNNDKQVVISIADNGPGISESVQQRLFDPFFTTKPVGKGTGLGLSISYQIVTKKHQGHLQCISAPGKGAEFLIKIPLRSGVK